MRAQIEFQEELGVRSHGDLIPLDFVKQKGGKIVHAWVVEGDLLESSELKSNLFEMEWPPRSGKLNKFPESIEPSFFWKKSCSRKSTWLKLSFSTAYAPRLMADAALPNFR